jgi:hypothetical protein
MLSRASTPILFSLTLTACLDDTGPRPDPRTPFGPVTDDGDESSGGDGSELDLGSGLSDHPAPPRPDLPDDAPSPDTEVCYPGPGRDWSVCLPLVALDPDAVPDGYLYPDPLPGMWNYRTPVAYLDLDALDPDTLLAPHFRLGEIARAWKGRYAVVQPHAVVRLQVLRDAVGPLKVDSGYRPPAFNAMTGGAQYSRHMYGDAFDLEPLDATADLVEDLCLDLGGHLFEYDTHVHCDWRDEPLDVRFFGESD